MQVNERVCSLESALHDAIRLELRIVITFGMLPIFTRRGEDEFFEVPSQLLPPKTTNLK